MSCTTSRRISYKEVYLFNHDDNDEEGLHCICPDVSVILQNLFAISTNYKCHIGVGLH